MGRQAKRGVRLEKVRDILGNKQVLEALAKERSAKFGTIDVLSAMTVDLQRQCDQALALIDKYAKGGSDAGVLKDLLTLRNEQIAHHQIERDPARSPEPARDDIEALYQDMMRLIGLLMSFVKATSYDLKETAGVHGHYAERFWAAARGERTEGHPNYRSIPPVPTMS